MSAAADQREARPGAPLALKLILPATQLGLGPVQIDPVARLFGKPVRELLGGLLAGEPERRATSAGSLVEICIPSPAPISPAWLPRVKECVGGEHALNNGRRALVARGGAV